MMLNEVGENEIGACMLKHIINLDETCLSLDGSNGTRGGRPEVVLFDPNLPRLGKATGKTAKTTTMITGSNAAREALPPHFQFQTAATADERQRLRNKMLQWMPNVIGKFGCDKEKEWPCTFAMNAKGEMDDKEFTKFMLNSIVPLYPEAWDAPGK